MQKKEAIDKILEMQQRMGQAIIPYAIHAWKELDVPLAQLKSLLIISAKKETNLSSLAEDLGVTPGDVTGIVERMVEQKLVSRNTNPQDRRVIWLQATDKGRKVLTNLLESQSIHMAHILEQMNLKGLESLLKGLAELIPAMERHQKDLK